MPMHAVIVHHAACSCTPTALFSAAARRDVQQQAEQRVADRLSDLARSVGSDAHATEQLQELMSPQDSDSWGTTRKSAAEIAKHIADSNAGGCHSLCQHAAELCCCCRGGGCLPRRA